MFSSVVLCVSWLFLDRCSIRSYIQLFNIDLCQSIAHYKFCCAFRAHHARIHFQEPSVNVIFLFHYLFMLHLIINTVGFTDENAYRMRERKEKKKNKPHTTVSLEKHKLIHRHGTISQTVE